MKQPVILVMGLPASGKSTISKGYASSGYVILNRDTEGGSVARLAPRMKELLEAGKNVVVDNLFLTAEGRWPFIEAANAAGRLIECHWMMTSFEDCQINALTRMWANYGRLFLTAADIKADPRAKKDSSVFPMGAMFAAKKKLAGDKKKQIPVGRPSMHEGFSKIVRHDFMRWPTTATGKAIILDMDMTLRKDAREFGGDYVYPTAVEQVALLPNRTQVLRRYLDEGYLLLGVTIQSGIGKGVVSEKAVLDCLAYTNRLLGLNIPWLMCPHHTFPVQCYCRKPQAGLGVQLIHEHNLDPSACVMVGDATSDKTFATRCGFQFTHADGFFKV